MQAVIDPPPYQGKYLFQEECCFSINPGWVVPASSLRVATQEECHYIRPVSNWNQFVKISEDYDTIFLIFSYPLSQCLDVPKEVRHKIVAIGNPSTFDVNIDDWGFKDVRRLTDYDLKIDERFYELYQGKETTVQIGSGCPFRCDYCVWNRKLGYKIKWSDPKESAHLANISKHSMLLCPQITGNSKWVNEFIKYKEKQPGFYTDINPVHIDTYEDIIKLKEVGLDRVIAGTETFSESALKRIGCPQTVKQNVDTIRFINDLKVYGAYQLRHGFGETVEEIFETCNVLVELGTEIKPEKNTHRVNVGPFLYWHESELSRSLSTHYVQYLGFPVKVETIEKERQKAWKITYEKLRKIGWNLH